MGEETKGAIMCVLVGIIIGIFITVIFITLSNSVIIDRNTLIDICIDNFDNKNISYAYISGDEVICNMGNNNVVDRVGVFVLKED